MEIKKLQLPAVKTNRGAKRGTNWMDFTESSILNLKQVVRCVDEQIRWLLIFLKQISVSWWGILYNVKWKLFTTSARFYFYTGTYYYL